MLFCASSEGSVESSHLHRLTLAFVTVPKSNDIVLPQIANCVVFTPAAKTLASLHICAGIVTGQCDNALAANALASLHIYTG